jgi:hypothetical protein
MSTTTWPSGTTSFRIDLSTAVAPQGRRPARRKRQNLDIMAKAEFVLDTVANAMNEVAPTFIPPVPTEITWSSEGADAGLRNLRAQIDELRTIEPDARPTPIAFQKVELLLGMVGGFFAMLREAVPVGYVMEDGEGGIRIEWESDESDKHVRLIVFGDAGKTDYIYYEDKSGPGLEAVRPIRLAKLLAWFST